MKRTTSSPHLLPTLTVGLFFSSIVTANTTLAQIISDDTLGNESSQINSLDSNTQQIDGGAIRGANLFHSFQEFNVNEGQTVNFSNPEGIAYIFSRVTGNNISEILGTLGVLGSADLFLLNPNGIIFGPNSSLNVNGSFLATSANSIHFADGNKFATANIHGSPLLTISTPIGLGFEQPPGTIVNRSNINGEGLTIGSASTLALVGGDILLEGATITASGGRIELASAAVDEVIGLQKVNNQWKLEYDGLWRGQNIRLTTGFDPNRNLPIFSLILAESANGNVGEIQLYSRNLVIDDGQIVLFSLDDTVTGNLEINALDTFQLRNNRFDENAPFLVLSVLGIFTFNEIDNTGEIFVDTQKLIIEEGGFIEGSSSLNFNPFTGEILGLIKGGNININAEELVEVRNGGGIKTNSLTFADSGNINITSPKVIISNQGSITAEATSFTTPVTEEVITATGGGGTISIVSDSLEIINDGIISSNTVGEGKAGSIDISTDNLRLQDGGTITVNSAGTGEAGDINIQAQSLFLDNNSLLSAITEQSDGGNINLQIQDSLTLRNQSKISTSVGGDGNGGNITIDTKFLIALLEENSDITANAEFGDGGNISISALDVIGIQFQETETELSDIGASSEFGLDGIVVISGPDTSISRTLIDATPPDVIDANNIFTNNYCKINQNSKYIVTGRGGLPLAPEREILPEYTWEDWRVIDHDTSANNPTVSNRGRRSPASPAFARRGTGDNNISLRSRSRLRLFKTEYLRPSPKNNSHPNKINPIQGWMVNQKGQIVLTANPIMVTPHAATTKTPGCS